MGRPSWKSPAFGGSKQGRNFDFGVGRSTSKDVHDKGFQGWGGLAPFLVSCGRYIFSRVLYQLLPEMCTAGEAPTLVRSLGIMKGAWSVPEGEDDVHDSVAVCSRVHHLQ